jgi:heterodisulfide reductase subunit C2
MSVSIGTRVDLLAGLIQQKSDISIQRCYQCGKCSAGCPASSEMDFAPSVLLRLLQLQNSEADQKVLSSYSIWLCLTCHTCIARCPMEVDLPKVMDVLRVESLRRKLVHPRAQDIVAFHKSFIDTIRNFGRLWEMGLIADYKLRTHHFWQDVVLAPVMLKKGKLSLIPLFHKKFVSRIFSGLRSREEQT